MKKHERETLPACAFRVSKATIIKSVLHSKWNNWSGGQVQQALAAVRDLINVTKSANKNLAEFEAHIWADFIQFCQMMMGRY
jgi:hypothetical protein